MQLQEHSEEERLTSGWGRGGLGRQGGRFREQLSGKKKESGASTGA